MTPYEALRRLLICVLTKENLEQAITEAYYTLKHYALIHREQENFCNHYMYITRILETMNTLEASQALTSLRTNEAKRRELSLHDQDYLKTLQEKIHGSFKQDR